MTTPPCVTYWSQFGTMEAIPQDASPRRYFRLSTATGSYIIADCSDAPELFDLCAQHYAWFQDAHLPVARIDMWHRPTLSWRSEDLGRCHLIDILDRFPEAFSLLAQLQSATPPSALPQYREQKIIPTRAVFEDYYLASATTQQEKNYTAHASSIWDQLIEIQAEIPSVWCHGDLHTQNIMRHPTHDRLYFIDYQDSLLGPLTLDYVSLIDDVRLPWDPIPRESWMQHWTQRLAKDHAVSPETMHLWLESTTLFRLLRILGVFQRLATRDHKTQYLRYIPDIERRMTHILRDLPAFTPIRQWLRP